MNLLQPSFVILVSQLLSSNAFVLPSVKTSFSSSSSLAQSAVSTDVEVFTQGPRIVRDQIPIVYVYDHCPFCVRVRLALGVKNVKHEVRFMANDDVSTPTSLIGKKIAPIINLVEEGVVMSESLDIIEAIDNNEAYGPTKQLKPASGRTDIKAWQKSVQTMLRTLQRPRYVATGLLPEFQQSDGRMAFIKNHQLPPYEKPGWKGDGTDENPGMDMDEKLKLYKDAMSADPTELVEALNEKLVELDGLVFSENYCTEGGFSMDDIDLWSRLRSVTIIDGVVWPEKLRSYMDNLSELGDVPLYDDMAL